jgi:isopentenyl-diphosphate Delta-isomerase
MEERLDVCDERDRVVGCAPRSEVHARKLLHRAVHVFVFNPAGELLMQLRTAAKDEYPLCYTSSASGHVSAGEGYDTSVERELEEELGLRGPVEFLQQFPAGPETSYEHTRLYRLTTSDPIRPDPGEVLEAEFVGLEELGRRMKREPDRYTPCFCTLLDWYLRHKL